MFPIAKLTRRTPGKIATTGTFNKCVDAINALNPPFKTGQVEAPRITPTTFEAVIWDAGPNAESDYDSTSGGRYWARLAYVASGLVSDAATIDNASTSTDEGTIVDAIVTVTNLAEKRDAVVKHKLKKNDPIEVFCVVDGGGTARFFTDAATWFVGELFAVALTQTGGADGSASAGATWTYTVKDLAGNTLGTAKSPTWARPKGKTNVATHGTSYWDSAGTLVLYQTDETPTVGVCA